VYLKKRENMNKAKLSISQQVILGLTFLGIVIWLALFVPAANFLIDKDGFIG
jgi:hypothetical protein